ncbi:hypothetical protein KHM83_01610 [Fusibacter paucivorans]|uniref:Transcriptional regulator n=1 Tax=Fusibacter paucivorans TaxID=76009 RepID=A0ABS5PJQ9_9FIRM|nr:hypothetical protein [Fusibacter paucivorans]MBS7525368.1 hypothetical protein [Fusibacter paucivorans]
MKIRIGVIGPKDSVEKIGAVTKEYEHKAQFDLREYARYPDVLELTSAIQQDCDIVMFSGEAPYAVAQNFGVLNKPAVFIPREGTSFYRTVWEIEKKQPGFKCLSSDIVLPDAVQETMEELGIPYDQTYHLKYEFSLDSDTIIAFHTKLWEAGKIDAAVTGFTSVYEALKRKGIHVYKVYPTKPLIRETIQKAILLGTVKKEQASQIAIQVVRMRNYDEAQTSDYHFMLIRNQLEQSLIRYTQTNFGAIFPFGRDEFMIFTNRGAITDVDAIYATQFGDLKENAILSSGIGLGQTVYEAERNARHALHYALQKKVNCIFLKDGEGVLSGPFMQESERWLSFHTTLRNDEMVAEIVEKSGISAAYIMKLRGLLEKLNHRAVDANTVADYLGISPRSARRILTDLVTAGFAVIVEEASIAQTGRPRKIYELKIETGERH